MPVGRGCIWVSDEAESAGRPETHLLTSTMTEGHTQVASTLQRREVVITCARIRPGWSRGIHDITHSGPPVGFIICGWRCRDEKAKGVPYNQRSLGSPLPCWESSAHTRDLISESSCSQTSDSFNYNSSSSPFI